MQEKKDGSVLGTDQRYYKMIEEVQDYAIILLDKDGYIQNWNRGAEKIKGYSEKEIIGKSFNLFYLPDDRKSGLPQKLITEAAETGRATHEGWRMRKDGTTFWGYVVITALHDDDDNIIGFTKVTRDLTERKIAEDQQLRDAKSIEMQNKQLEEFAYITSHDLQEPIRKIQTFAQLLENKIDDMEAVKKYVGKINASAERMVLLIRDVLNFSRLSQAREQFSKVDLNIILEEVLDDFELLIAERNVTVHAEALPVLDAIPVQINQLFTNLISNAVKFNDGDPVITITSEKAYVDTIDYYKLVFSDNGIGFEQKYADQAFQPFRRLTSEYSGTGIGLALCKKIMDNHRGDISVSSEPGKGATFEMLFPTQIPEMNEE